MSKERLDSTTDTPEQVAAALGRKREAKESEVEENSEKSASSEESEDEKVEKAEDESDTSDKKEAKSEDDEDSEESEDEKEAKETKSKVPRGVEKKISKLTKLRREAEREAEYWKNLAMNGQQSGAKEEKQDKPQDSKSTRPNVDDFETEDEYIEAITDWKLDQREAKKAKEAQEKEQSERAKTIQERIDSFASTVDDFDEVIEEVSDIQFPAIVAQAMQESENTGELMYNLSKDHETLAKLSDLMNNPVKALEVFVEFKSGLKPKASKEKEVIKKTTKAPRPLDAVKTKSGNATKSPDEMSFREYKAWRESQRA